jgi:DNA-binding protein YbaB
MSKLKILKNKIKAMQEQYEKAVLEQHQKIGAIALSLYEKDTLRDVDLRNQIAKIIGEDSQSDTATTDSNILSRVE